MPVYYTDSSAVVKRYVRETGSAWVSGLFTPSLANEVFIVAVTSVEVVAAITRRARGGTLSASDAATACNLFLTDVQSDLQVVEVTEVLITQAVALARSYALRGYDALQLAAGCQVNALSVANGLPPVIFVSADHRLSLAAVSEGLAVDDPNTHS